MYFPYALNNKESIQFHIPKQYGLAHEIVVLITPVQPLDLKSSTVSHKDLFL